MEKDTSGFTIESNKPIIEEVIAPVVEAEAEATTSSEAEVEAVNEAPKPPSKSRAQKRIEALIQEKHDLSRRLQDAEAKASAPKAKELDPDSFEDYDDYLAAVAEEKPSKVKTTQHAIDDMAVVMEQIEEKFEDSRELHDDFDEKVTNPSLAFTNDLLKMINESDEAGEVAYYLANNPKETKRIAQLSQGKMAIEIGKIELKLNQPKEVEKPLPKKITRSQDPINPVGGANGAPRSIYEATTQREYEAMRRATSKSNGWA
jgi:hypothetical protein